jgi:transposase
MKMGSHSSRSPLEAFSNEIIALIDTKPDITLTEIVGHLEVEYGLKTSRSSVDRFFARNGVTLKKRQRMQQNRSGKT